MSICIIALTIWCYNFISGCLFAHLDCVFGDRDYVLFSTSTMPDIEQILNKPLFNAVMTIIAFFPSLVVLNQHLLPSHFFLFSSSLL